VLIGSGQVNHRDGAADDIDPVRLMAAAARRAGEPAVLRAVDAIRVVNLLSWRATAIRVGC
jgi:acetyl-CoA C-acetyltransferase